MHEWCPAPKISYITKGYINEGTVKYCRHKDSSLITNMAKKHESGKCEGVRCTKDKICNPASGRCVLRTGKIGKRLLAKEKPSEKPKVKSKSKSGKCEGVRCTKDKICNPASGRCVLRTGKDREKFARKGETQ